MHASSSRASRRGVSEPLIALNRQKSFTTEDCDVFQKVPMLPRKVSPHRRHRQSSGGRSGSKERRRAPSVEAASGRVRMQGSAVHRSRTAGKASSGAMADVAGAVGMFCSFSQDTDSIAPPVSHRNRSATSSASALRHMADNRPALPPRMPMYNKHLSGQSSRKPRSRSSDMQSSGSVISPDAIKDAPSSELHDDTLDVFIPLSGDDQTLHSGLDEMVGLRDKTDNRKQFLFDNSESEQTVSVNVSAESQECVDEDVGLDVIVGTEDEADNVKQPVQNIPDSPNFANVSADNSDCLDDNKNISKDRLWPYEQSSKRIRPNIGRRLTRKETTKLSRKLTRKMSCRQQHALMMASEFDEFDELDVVVETEDIADDDDEDDVGGHSKLSSVGIDSDGLQSNLQDIDNTDASFDQRVTTKLQYDQLQVDMDSGQITQELKDAEMTTVQRIANELLCTERTYVKKLYIIDQLFHAQIIKQNRTFRYFPDDVIPQMFCNVKSIYQFHNDFLLPQLEQRMSSWKTMPYIGDVMKKFAPFLKLYTDYVKNFDHAMDMINAWAEKSADFASLLRALQDIPECGHLTLQHHMLEPIQRVPRYELLLRDYLKHLDADSPDRENTEIAVPVISSLTGALALVAKAAFHSNEAMRKMEKFRKLLDINESLGETIDLISPTRELIKEGKILRVAARDGNRYERYMFLFNDLVLICTSIAVVIGSKQRYRIKSKIDIDGMQICDGDNLVIANTFIIKGRQKSIELLASSPEETSEWMSAIEKTIADFTDKLRSRKACRQLDVLKVEELGVRAPTWVKDQETSMCMRCTDTFTMFRRRHHCRACGLVVCSRCSTQKIALSYDEGRENKVCDDCYAALQHSDTPTTSDLTLRRKAPGALQVKASDPAVISGYLNMSVDNRTWHRRWFCVHSDFVLYSFKAHQDVVAMTSLPLPGYQVAAASDGTSDVRFVVSHAGSQKTYYFYADTARSRDRWVEVLKSMVMMVLPEQPVVSSPNPSSSVHPLSTDCSSSSMVLE